MQFPTLAQSRGSLSSYSLQIQQQILPVLSEFGQPFGEFKILEVKLGALAKKFNEGYARLMQSALQVDNRFVSSCTHIRGRLALLSNDIKQHGDQMNSSFQQLIKIIPHDPEKVKSAVNSLNQNYLPLHQRFDALEQEYASILHQAQAGKTLHGKVEVETATSLSK